MNIGFLMYLALSMFTISEQWDLPQQYCFTQSDITLLQNYSNYNYDFLIPEEYMYSKYEDLPYLFQDEAYIVERITKAQYCINELWYEKGYMKSE